MTGEQGTAKRVEAILIEAVTIAVGHKNTLLGASREIARLVASQATLIGIAQTAN